MEGRVVDVAKKKSAKCEKASRGVTEITWSPSFLSQCPLPQNGLFATLDSTQFNGKAGVNQIR